MKYTVILSVLLILFGSCQESSITPSLKSSLKVSNQSELNEAIANAEPGNKIVLKNGIWEDVNIRLNVSGTEEKPITLSAETPGSVLIQGASDLKLGGDYLIVDGLYFVNGYGPSKSVISFAIKDTVANHCRLTNCVIKDYNKSQRNQQDLWVIFRGKHNQMDHCYLTGKSNKGPTVRVDLEGNRNINNYHQIINNHFGPRPPKGGPSAETIQIGSSYTSMSPSYTMVANNLFEECNGEVEIISSKTNFNEFRNNVFYKSEGSLVTRHGNYCTVDGNYFIGVEGSENVGGIRLIGTGHNVTNNYFYNLSGVEFRSPLAIMNGIPKSPLNRYIQVTDVTVAHNSWINCKSPWHFGVGSNVSMKDVLPASEIRSARPKRTVVANNLIYNTKGDKNPVMAHDKLDGIQFKNNLINNQGVEFDALEGLETASFTLKELEENILVPTGDFPEKEVYVGYGFEQFSKDLFGKSRDDKNSIGAVVGQATTAPAIFDKKKYGTNWFDAEQSKKEAKTYTANASKNIADVISQAQDGAIIELEAGNYEIASSLKIDKELSIQAKGNAEVTLSFKGGSETPLFEMNPKGQLSLKGIKLMGTKNQYAFAPLKKGMSSLYNLSTEQCMIEGFDYVLKGHKYSMAEHLTFTSTRFINCNNGIELSEEIEDKGEYNAENISIVNCHFEGVDANVLDYYRGGYDESTVGGNLSITNSTFTKCGAKEKNGVLLNTYGIINVAISGNTFKDNRVKLIAQLWGAKNNSHSDNKITNSGKINVEENLKLNLLY